MITTRMDRARRSAGDRLRIGMATLLSLAFALAPTAVFAADEPIALERSVVVEEDGIRLSMTIERNPVRAGEPVWIRTTLRNVGDDAIVWQHGRCDSAVLVSGEMRDIEWRQGEPATGGFADFAWSAKSELTSVGTAIQLEIEPKGSIGTGGYGCSEIGYTDRVPPGASYRNRSRWDGTAQWQLGALPGGPATITATFGGYRRAGDTGRADKSVEASLDVLVTGGLDPDALHPPEIIDAALDDTGFAALIETIDVGDGNDPYVQYDPDLDLWQVGVLETRRDLLRIALVDQQTGDVVAVIERPFIDGTDPRPSSD